MGHLEGIYGVYGPVGAAWEGPLGHSPGSVSWGLGYVEGIYGAYGPVGVEYGPVGQSSPIGPTPSSVSGELRQYDVGSMDWEAQSETEGSPRTHSQQCSSGTQGI